MQDALPHAVTLVEGDAALMQAAGVAWATELLRGAVRGRGVAVTTAGDAFTVRLAVGADPAAEAAAAQASVDLPHVREGLALLAVENGVIAWGSDRHGLVHALAELADRATLGTGALFGTDFPLVERPSARIRSIARLFCSEAEDRSWFHDRAFWHAYLDNLATQRFNRFALTLGMGYNYPYHNNIIRDVYFYFPYPFLLDVPGYRVDVAELDAAERAANLESLQFIARETARRGLDFQLALWTQRYDFDDVPNANHHVRGITDDNLAPYCRDAITALLRAVPEVTGVTFRVHVEGGIPEGDYAFWEQAFAGVAAAGRTVEIDMHAKGLDHRMIALARASGMPITCSPKYLAEHMGLPYHQSAIREREYPPQTARSEREQLSEGSRKFLRYSYGDLLSVDRDWKVLYRIWAGTQRVLLWGDPVLAAGYGRSAAFCGSDGVEWCEPGSFKGRAGTGVVGQRFCYQTHGLRTHHDWEKYRYLYRVWGRLLFNPEAPRESWMRYLRHSCGDAAEACEQALGFASRVLPLVTLAHGPSASNNYYWPEIYTNLPVGTLGSERAYAHDMDGAVRFGNAPTFDPQLLCNPLEYAAALHAGRIERRYTPADVADWLNALADGSDRALVALRGTTAYSEAEVQRVVLDVTILSGIARFFAAKFMAATWVELFLLSRADVLLNDAEAWLRRAVAAWECVCAVSRDTYPDDLTYGPQSWLRGSWQARLQSVRDEATDLHAMRATPPHATVHPDAATQRAIASLRGRAPTRRAEDALRMPEGFRAGDDVEVGAEIAGAEDAVLHYRHVNQAERWRAVPMSRAGSGMVATIPGDYTRAPFHLQLIVSTLVEGKMVIAPGFEQTLANEPYATILQQSSATLIE